MAYHDPVHATYALPAADLTSAATLMSVVGPPGKTGRLVGITGVVSTGVTDNAAEVTVGTGDDADAYGALSVPVSSSGESVNDATIEPADDNLIPADSVVEIATDGAATAGEADLAVHIAWF